MTEAEDIKKRQKARLSDAALRDTIIALGNGDTLHKYYTMPSMGMQAKSKRKGMCIQPVPTDGRERAGQPFPCLLKSDSICPLNAPSPLALLLHNGIEGSALFRQAVFHLGRDLRIFLALN